MMADSITIKDFQLICRVCLKFSNNLVSISKHQIIEMISSCSSVQISLNDELPNHLCSTCLTELQNAFNFKRLSENSDSKLRQIIDEYNLSKNLIDNTDCEENVREEKNFSINFIDSIKYESELDCNISIKDDFENETKCIIQNVDIVDLKYSCDKCNLKFSHLHHLELHTKRYHKVKAEQCPKCNSEFYNQLLFQQHINCHEEKFPSIKCNICNKTFKTPSKLMRHSAVHRTERPYQCSHCEKTFKLDSALKVHKRIAHSTKDNRVPCDVCGKRVLKRHVQRHQIIHKNDRDFVQCDKCERKFLHQTSLNIHIRRDHEKIVRKDYLCNTCGKKYSSRTALKRHSVGHRPERPYQCTQCNKNFKLDFILTKHIRTMHSSNINIHVKLPCKICGKEISKTNMQTHMKIHRNNRDMIKCNQCSKQFLHRISLKLHIRHEHENITRDLKHLCNICGRGAGSRTELELHMLSHSDEKTFECDKCGKKYKSRHGLTHHNNTTHLNLRPHACTLCAQRFALKATLAAHMRTHTGERPFQCIVCEKTFSQKSSLQTHIKLVHTDKNI